MTTQRYNNDKKFKNLKFNYFIISLFRHIVKRKGFTIAELMVSTMILAILVVTGAAVYSNLFSSVRNIKAANLVYEEARFVMERIVKEIRNGAIDYEEYYNQATNFFGTALNETYGQNYCQYSRQFYSPGPDGQYGTYDDESTGKLIDISPGPDGIYGTPDDIRTDREEPTIKSTIQEKLYLIDPTGTRRTYIQRTGTVDSYGQTIGKVAMLQLDGFDYGIDHIPADQSTASSHPTPCLRDSGEKDGLIDTWMCAEGFTCFPKRIETSTCLMNNWPIIIKDNPFGFDKKVCTGDYVTVCNSPADCDGFACEKSSSFMDITPAALDIVDLKFFITPPDDPRKAYANPDVQIQPHVTVKLIARANPRIASEFRGRTPDIVLETTITTRTQAEIITECNLQECIDLDTRSCPKTDGVSAGAEQTCLQARWPGCTTADYEAQAASNISDGIITPTKPDEEGNPIPSETVGGLDNEPPFGPGGRTFYENRSEFSSCIGMGDPDEDACKNRRCTDGVDNDCDGKTDSADSDCLLELCNNGFLDPGEECIDVGGICYFRPWQDPTKGEDEAPECFDGYDNDCDYDFDLTWADILANTDDPSWLTLVTNEGLDQNSSVAEWNIALRQGADEYDQSCINYICSETYLMDPDLGPDFYDTPYYLAAKPDSPDELGQICTNIGGLCKRSTLGDQALKTQESTGDPLTSLCYDNLDNDCDGFADELDYKDNSPTSEMDCEQDICNNNAFDCGLVNNDYSPADYLLDYDDAACNPLKITALDEKCEDVGGLLCEAIGKPNPDVTPEDSIIAPFRGCLDGIDNDCINGFDGNHEDLDNLDPNCCVDRDGDGFPGITEDCTTDWKTVGDSIAYDYLFGYIDCDDSDPDIFPRKFEYMAGLFEDTCGNTSDGNGIDNNCSGTNGVNGGRDDEETSCCIDDDGDGYGLDGNHINLGSGQCDGPVTLYLERTQYDCDGTDPNIYPNQLENTVALCTDGLNNNCRIFNDNPDNPRKDHIDMYAADPGLEAAVTFHLFDPECCELTAFSYDPNLEICNDTNSLLNPGVGSDENCNGLEGYNDHFCMTTNKLTFHDYFSKANYINIAASSAQYFHNIYPLPAYQDSRFTINDPSVENVETIISYDLPLDTTTTCANDVFSVTITHNADIPGETTITYEVSNDGGDTFEPALPNPPLNDGDTHNFTTLDGDNHDLRWRATLTGNNVDTAPTLNDITVSFTCN